MASFVVMTAPGRVGPDGPDAEFICDRFAFLGFIVPWLWLLWHRLWIESLLAFAVSVSLAALGNVAGFGIAAPLLSILVSIYVGLEGAALRVAALRRRGYAEWGVVEADSLDDAETRFLTEWDDGNGSAASVVSPPPLTPSAQTAQVRVQPGPGLLLNPGNR